jgi:hypothetical protein
MGFKEDYAKGMQVGAEGAWDIARDILQMQPDTRFRLFGSSNIGFIFRMFNVSEAKRIVDDYQIKKSRFKTIFSLLDDFKLTDDDINEFVERLRNKKEQQEN